MSLLPLQKKRLQLHSRLWCRLPTHLRSSENAEATNVHRLSCLVKPHPQGLEEQSAPRSSFVRRHAKQHPGRQTLIATTFESSESTQLELRAVTSIQVTLLAK